MGKIVAVMGGALALSLIGNVYLLKHSEHQVEKKVECVQAVKDTVQHATEKKVVIETRQDNATKFSEATIRARIAAVNNSLRHDQGGQSDLSKPSDTAHSPNGEGGNPLFFTEDDERICKVNTIKLIGWQEWYISQMLIRKEEDAANSKDHSVPSPRGGDSTGSVSGLGGSLDMGAGSDEPIGAPSLSTVFPQPPVDPALR